MEKFIHIHAKCEAFEIFEQVKEDKAVSRLIKIRSMFNHAQKRRRAGQLVVKTILANPEFQF